MTKNKTKRAARKPRANQNPAPQQKKNNRRKARRGRPLARAGDGTNRYVEFNNPLTSLAGASSGVARMPAMASNGQSISVRHREMVCSVASRTLFTAANGGSLNPGLPHLTGVGANASVYTWVQGIANLYERYKIKAMRFVYEPTCSITSTGTIAMLIDYDPKDATPVSMEKVISTYGAVYAPPWKAFSIPVKPQLIPMFVRSTAGTSDVRLVDYGFWYSVVEGGLAADEGATVGRIFVEYDIEFTLPVAA